MFGSLTLLTTNCTMLRTEDAVRIVNSFITFQSHVTTFTHYYFLLSYAFTQLQFYTFVTTITCSTLTRLHSLRALHSNLYCTITHKVSYFTQCVFTGRLLSYRSLSQIITHCRARKVFTLHCETLAEISLLEFTS
jgi:hypothetical protein